MSLSFAKTAKAKPKLNLINDDEKKEHRDYIGTVSGSKLVRPAAQ